MNFRIKVLLVSAMLLAMVSAVPMLLTNMQSNNTAAIRDFAGNPVGGGAMRVILPFGDPVGGGVPQNQPNGTQTV